MAKDRLFTEEEYTRMRIEGHFGTGSGQWGLITGDINSQTDLVNKLNLKLDATKCTYQTTAPTHDATDGGVHIVQMDEEPETYYEGYVYLVKGTPFEAKWGLINGTLTDQEDLVDALALKQNNIVESNDASVDADSKINLKFADTNIGTSATGIKLNPTVYLNKININDTDWSEIVNSNESLQTTLDTKLENVKVNGTELTIVGKAVEIPKANATDFGVVIGSANKGILINSDGTLQTQLATKAQIENPDGNDIYKVITPDNIGYGVKKALGVTLVDATLPNSWNVFEQGVARATLNAQKALPTYEAGKYLHVNEITNVLEWSDAESTATWGAITGTLNDQLDLKAALDAKATLPAIENNKFLHTNATTGALEWAASTASVDWGNIGGTMANQTDLQTALDSKLLASKSTYQTTLPTGAISDGGIHIVYCLTEPAIKYSGYIYMVAE